MPGAAMRAEQWAVRDRCYGVWHRVRSIARYLSPTQSAQLTMLDVDSVLFAEFRFTDKLPLALVEVARDVGQEKDTAVLRYRCDGLRARCPYPMESAECDAWYAGTDEGHRRWREHASNRGQA